MDFLVRSKRAPQRRPARSATWSSSSSASSAVLKISISFPAPSGLRSIRVQRSSGCSRAITFPKPQTVAPIGDNVLSAESTFWAPRVHNHSLGGFRSRMSRQCLHQVQSAAAPKSCLTIQRWSDRGSPTRQRRVAKDRSHHKVVPSDSDSWSPYEVFQILRRCRIQHFAFVR